MPPVIVTPNAMEKLSRMHKLLEMEEKPNASIIFEPKLETPAHSTGNESDLDLSIVGLEDQFSRIEFAQDALRGDVSSFLEKNSFG